MKFTEVDHQNFDLEVLETKGRLVVVYFWGTDCPNCQVFNAHVPEIDHVLGSGPVAKIKWVKANAYVESDLATRFGLHGVPTFFLVRDGKILGRMTSFQSVEFFTRVILENL